MKGLVVSVLTIFSHFIFCQENNVTDKLYIPKGKGIIEKERIVFDVKYGVFNTSSISIVTKFEKLNGKIVYHVSGYGKTVGLARLFFKVEDHYDTYINAANGLPIKFVRNIYEGGYTKNLFIEFNHEKEVARVNNIKKNTVEEFKIQTNTQDMVSAVFFMRNYFDLSRMNIDESIFINTFFDESEYVLRFKLVAREYLETKIGKLRCMKFVPLIQSGRVFKENESLAFWLTDDERKIPVLIKADLAVGSINCVLNEYGK